MGRERCDSCGRTVHRGTRFCPACGVELSAAVTLDIASTGAPEGAEVALVELHPSKRPLLIAAVLAGGIAFVSLVFAVSRPAPVAPPPTAEVAVTSTTLLPTSTVPGSTTTEPLLTAHKVAIPAGLHGQAWLLFSDGSVVRVDLTTGLLSVVADGVIERIYRISSENARFVVLDDGVMIWVGGRVAMVPFDGDGRAVAVGEDLDFVTGGDHYVVLRREQPGSRIVRIVVDGHGNVRDLPELGSVASVVGVAGDHIVVQAADQIGLLDLTDGSVAPVARGSYVASNRWGLVRLECPQPPTCELHTGPWSSLDERVTPATFTVPTVSRAGPPQLSVDGSTLAVPGAVTLDAFDTATGKSLFQPIVDPRLFALSSDGKEILAVSGDQATIERPFVLSTSIGTETMRGELVGVALTA